jgi:hypothetical protein
MSVVVAASAITVLEACDGGGDDDSGAGDDDDTAVVEGPIKGLTVALHEELGSVVVASWEQLEPAEVIVEYGFGGDLEWLQAPALDAQVGPQRQLLLGIPYGETVNVHVVWNAGDGPETTADRTIDTAALPEGLTHAEVDVLDREGWDPAMNYVLLSLNEDGITGNPNHAWTLIIDRQGRLVWGLPTPAQRTTLHTRAAMDGRTLLIDHNSYWAVFDNGALSQVQRITIDGGVVETLDTPGLHHPFTDLPDGSLLWGAMDYPDETLERLYPDGTRECLWSCEQFHAEIGEDDFCASNTLSYDAATESVLFSFYTTNSIVEIDLASAEAVRWFGQLPGAWAFDPEDSTFWWQHGGYITDDGTLLLSTRVSADGDETVVREYELDSGAETLRQIWSFGEGQGIYGSELGEAHRLPGGNTLHNYGNAVRLREVTDDGEIVWEIHWIGIVRVMGRSSPLEDLYSYLP